MSVLDQLSSSLNNSANGAINNALGTQANSNFFQPLDVQASVLFTNLSTTLNIKGKSLSTDQNNKLYSLGFTPEVDFYISPSTVNQKTNYPVERGVILDGGIINSQFTKYGVLRDTNDILNTDIPNTYESFDDESSEEFLHRLDQEQIPIGAALGRYNDMYLSSFVSTEQDNEDPISFGYDLIINYANSPLFNGAIEDFITQFSSYSELKSRMNIIAQFKNQFFNFFKVDSPTSLNLRSDVITRTYYLKKITGLDGLTESILSDKSKQFVDYGNDLLTLTLNEDVSVNMGYLASLYKILTWSKVHGKKMFPDNLLRFDMEIVVTEARRFNRLNKNIDSTLTQYADLISRYRYKVYECQFFFDKMSHGDTIDMWGLGLSDGFDIKINYKFSTVKFEKFTNFDFTNNAIIVNYGSTTSLDNSKVDLTKIYPSDTNKFSINNGTIQLSPIEYVLNKYSGYAPNSTTGLATDEYKNLYQSKTTDDIYAQRLANMHQVQSANTISLRQQLLNKTLENISSEFALNFSNIKGMILGKLLSGFTEDGYEYNIPAHYVNKGLNTASNLLGQLVNPVVNKIYGEKVLLQESALMNINSGINFLTNQLNGAGQRQNIYGNGGYTSPVYAGDAIGNDNPTDTPAHNTGAPFSIYEHVQTESDTPAHYNGTTFDIYANKKEEPNTPTHHTGTTFDIYEFEPVEPDTPPHHPGSPFDIYASVLPDSADTPVHHIGTTFDIYAFEPVYPDTPIHHNGATLDIYAYQPIESDTPPHHNGGIFNIYVTRPELPDTPQHHFGIPFNIYV